MFHFHSHSYNTEGVDAANDQLIRTPHFQSHVSCIMMLRSFSSIRQIVNLNLRNAATTTSISKPVDPLYQGIRSATAVDQVWQLIDANAANMNEVHVITTLKMLKKIAVSCPPDSTESIKPVNLMKNIHFEKLCSHTLRIMRTMSPRNLYQLLSHLEYLAVPVNTVIFKSLLVMIKNRMNEFTLAEIVMMDIVLARLLRRYDDQMAPNQLLSVVRMALPLLVEIKVQFREVPYDDTDIVVNVLRYSCNNRLKITVVNHLMESINSRRETLNPYQCFTVMLSLSKAYRRPESDLNVDLARELTEHCMIVLAKSDYERWQTDIRRIFERSPKLPAYNKEYFDRATSLYKSLFPTLDTETMERVMKTFELNNHIDQELLNLYQERSKDANQRDDGQA